MRTLLRSLSRLSILSLIAIYGCSTGGLTTRVADFLDEGRNALRANDLGRAQEQFQKGLAEAQRSGDYQGMGFTLNGLGDVYRARKEYGLAIEKYQGALPFFSGARNRFMEALTLQQIAGIEQQIGNDQEAVVLLNNAINIWNELLGTTVPKETDKSGLASRAGAVYIRANSHRNLRQFQEAVRDYRAAASHYRLIGDHGMAGLTLWFAAGIISDELGQSESAIELYTEAIPLLDATGKVDSANSARLRLGHIYLDVRKSGYAEKAAKVFGEALPVAERDGLSEDISDAHFGLARAFEMRAEFDKALLHYQAMLEQDRLLGGGEYTNPDYVGFYAAKAKIYRHLGRYEEAIEHFSAVLLKLKEIKDEKGEAGVSTMLAETYLSIDDPHTAIRYYKRALELYKKTGDTFSQINVLSALGELWLSGLVSSEEAIEYLETARQLLTSVKGLDLLTLLQGTSANKAPTGKTLKELVDGADETLTGKTLRDIVNFATENLSSFDRKPVMVAGNFYQRAGRIFLQDGKLNDADYIAAAELFLQLAWVYHQLFFDRESGVERMKDSYFLGEATRELGYLDAALAMFRASEHAARVLRTPEIHWAYSGSARTYADLGDYENAIEYYKKGLSTLESIHEQQVTERSKIGVSAGAAFVYGDLIPLLLKTFENTRDERYLREAFHYTESLKARSFREMFFTSRAARLGGEVGEFVAKEEKFRLEIQMINDRLQSVRVESADGNRLLDRLDEIRNNLVSLKRESAKENPRFAQILASEPVTFRHVQDSLTSDDVFLEYSISDKGLTVWIITKDDTRHAIIQLGKTAVEAFEHYLKTLREPMIGLQEISKHVTLGKELYRVLLGEAETFLRRKNHLIIVPDGLLHYLPFEALIETSSQDETKKYTALADLPYLIKKFQISYVPSASVLVAQKNERVRQQHGQLPLLAFGDPVYQDSQLLSQMPENDLRKITNVALRGLDLKRLEFSGEEVRRIARIWEVSPTSDHVNLGERATVERVRALDLSPYRIIHFATHAVAGDQVGWASQPALVLSQQSKNNQAGGLLQFSDILDLKLNADLVVLSACETGLGKLRYGEGIIGLTRAFIYAGASSAVVSLWKVEDQSTSLLMEKFYQWLKKGTSKAEALRQAKLEILNSTIELKALGTGQSLASPFFWAPFILIGDPAPLRN